MTKRWAFPSSLVVTMSLPVAGSAVRPSRCPATFHRAAGEPEVENSTTVDSRLPAPCTLPEGTGSPLVPTEFWKPTKILPLRPVMSSGCVTDACPLGVLILIGVPPAKAVLLNPEAFPVVELAVPVVLDELAVLLDLLLEPQAVKTAPAITAAAARLAVDARARRGAFKRDGLIVGSGRTHMSGE